MADHETIIWTFVSGLTENHHDIHSCTCNINSKAKVPDFVRTIIIVSQLYTSVTHQVKNSMYTILFGTAKCVEILLRMSLKYQKLHVVQDQFQRLTLIRIQMTKCWRKVILGCHGFIVN